LRPVAETPMNQTKLETDRRKEKRYKVISGAYAVLSAKPNKLGQISNISRGGLAFRYIADNPGHNGAQRMDVFIRNENYFLKDIPIKPVYDIELAKEDPFSTILLRQQSVQFGELTEEQNSKLMHLLQHHTLGEL
jgi:hypothetical protein